MPNRRPLTDHETHLVNRLRERARINAEVVWLESKIKRSPNRAIDDKRIVDLRSRLEALHAVMELANKQGKSRA